MTQPQPSPKIADAAPSVDALTPYDHAHLITYLRLLDADAEGSDWAEVAQIVLDLDPKQNPDQVRATWQSHLDRARWVMKPSYEHLLRTLRNALHGSDPP